MNYENVFILNRLGSNECLATTLRQAIEHFLGYEVTILNSSQDAKYLFGAREEYEKIPLLYLSNSSRTALEADVFGLHCLLRHKYRGNNSTWVGGLIVLPCNVKAAEDLLSSPIYEALSGHSVLSFPIRLLDLLSAVENVGELHRGAWALAAEKTGLVRFWKLIDSATSILDQGDNHQARECLTSAVNEVLQSGSLKKLLPHVEVVRRIESILQHLGAISRPTTEQLREIRDDIVQSMSEYKL